MTTPERAHIAWRRAQRIKTLSDRLIGIGPFGIGLDGILAWIPGLNLAYGLGAGAFLLNEGVKAGAKTSTLAWMGIVLAFDNLTDLVPIAGDAVDMLFPGHLLAANALQKDIEARHGLPPEHAPKMKTVEGSARFKNGPHK
ncbi:MAG: hypothetical protein JWM33_1970 [Caulobacteraceae bacterium]|nr:hypothetical protein [Caulobacteraceae bacterium]